MSKGNFASKNETIYVLSREIVPLDNMYINANINEMENILEKAINLAKEVHKGKLDGDGNPLLDHLLRVMSEGNTIDEKLTGMLHHLIEESNITPSDLLKD